MNGLAAKCTDANRVPDDGWNDMSCRTAEPNRSSASLMVVDCVLDHRLVILKFIFEL